MAYSDKAKQMRRCTALRKDGKPCQAWALWGGTVCASHTYKTRGPGNGRPWEAMRSKAPPCTCGAYAWPHRRGGGLCRWPDPPAYVYTVPAGTHSAWAPHRMRAALLTGGSLSTENVHTWANVYKRRG